MPDPLIPTPVAAISVRSAVTTSSAASPHTTTLTLPRNGIWIVTIQTRIANVVDHMMTSMWLSQKYDGSSSNDLLLSTQLGTTAKSANSAILATSSHALSAPTSAGVLTATHTWADGQPYSVAWDILATLQMDLT